MQTLILCGGKGTRAYPHTLEVPKPLLEVGSVPILRHVMEIYADQGFDEFVLAAGYRADLIEEFVRQLDLPWRVQVMDTGVETGTGARIQRCRSVLGERFLATYADGVGSIDVAALLAFHDAHGGAVTVTAVPLPSPYGTLEWGAGGQVQRFVEKPRLTDHWINAGFFVVDQRAFSHWVGHDLEREVLPALAGAGELYAYQHTGFWRSMDTYKDALELSALGREGRYPWTISPGPECWSPEPPGSSGRTWSDGSSSSRPVSTP